VSPAYVDSSALVKLVLDEEESSALRQYLALAGPLASSILAIVEVTRAVARVAPESAAGAVAVLEAVSLVAFDARIAARAAALGPVGLRTLDAVHLATALELRDELTAFVSYDDRLSAAALAMCLPVVAPKGGMAVGSGRKE
jgi:predicted nucleic acid-binding protein